MYCSKCGNKINEVGVFCPKCGSRVSLLSDVDFIEDEEEEYDDIDDDNQNEEVLRCPYCDSKNIYAHKKGFSGKKAVTGAVLTGGVGILAGTIGSNKVQLTCLDCGKTFNPGDKEKMDETLKLMMNMKTSESVLGSIFLVGGIIAIIAFFVYLLYSLL